MPVALALALVLAAPQILSLDAAHSSVSYTLVHKLHQFTGTDHSLEGRCRVLDDGTVQAAIRGDVKDFESGNGNRDEHMMETVEAARFPTVTTKATMKIPPGGPSGSFEGKAHAEFTLHGVSQALDVPLKVEVGAGGKVHVTGSFDTSVEGFHIKRPELLLIPINDAMKVVVDLWFTRGS